MGRTCRKRKRRKKVNSSDDEDFYNFHKWMIAQGWKPSIKLKVTCFPDTGRGLMAMECLNSGDPIVKIPCHLLITAKTVSNSLIGEIFIRNNVILPIHVVLSAFLLYEKHLGLSSYWKEYISMLPASFTSPIFCPEKELNMFPKFIIEEASHMKRIISNLYDTLTSACHSSKCVHCDVAINSIFSREAFQWAWFAVNSRSVYISPSENMSHSLTLLDSNSLALAPYLDMLNHSNNTQVSASFHSGLCYELNTLVPVKKYNQVFIHYGSHNNFRLFMDYGFILPHNEHDVFVLKINDILSCLLDCPNTEQNLKFIQDNCPTFLEGLNFSRDGLSWNCKVLIYLLLCPFDGNIKSLLQNVYHDKFEDNCLPIVTVGKKILDQKMTEIKDNVEKLNCECSIILSIGKHMLQSYLSILKTCEILFTNLL